MSETTPSIRPPAVVPPWRRRVAYYLLLAVLAVVAVHLLSGTARQVDVSYSLTGLEVREGELRLGRESLVELQARVFDGDTVVGESAFYYRWVGERTNAPHRTTRVTLPLREGEYRVEFRLVFEPVRGGPRIRRALDRALLVGREGAPVVVEVR